MLAPTTSGLRCAFAAILIIVLTLSGVGRAVATVSRPVDIHYAIPGLQVPICHSDAGTSTDPADPIHPTQHDCCDECALLAPVVIPVPPSLTGPASVEHYAEHAHAVAWVPAIARLRTPRQSQGPPAA